VREDFRYGCHGEETGCNLRKTEGVYKRKKLTKVWVPVPRHLAKMESNESLQ
jgi:hypothetical protein